MHNRFYRSLLSWASLTGAVGVALGAFGAHFLKARLEPNQLDTLRTGVLYLFIHVLACLVVALLGLGHGDSRWLRLAGRFFLAGILLFTGSLVWISTSGLTGLPVGFIGPVTPIGGLLFIAGWVMLARHGRQS